MSGSRDPSSTSSKQKLSLPKPSLEKALAEFPKDTMSHIRIEKFVAGQVEQRIRVPATAIRALALILPASAFSELKSSGIDIQAILQAQKTGMPYSATINVTEDGVQKDIRISVT